MRTLGKVELLGDEVEQETDEEETRNSDCVSQSYGALFADCEGDCHPHDEEEGGEDEISRSESVPLCVVEEPGRVGDRSHVVDEDHADHGESSVHVK